jgi:hypothetical protein
MKIRSTIKHYTRWKEIEKGAINHEKVYRTDAGSDDEPFAGRLRQ